MKHFFRRRLIELQILGIVLLAPAIICIYLLAAGLAWVFGDRVTIDPEYDRT